MTKQLYTRTEAAALLNVHPRTIDNWLRSGELRRANTQNTAVQRPASEIERIINAQAQVIQS